MGLEVSTITSAFSARLCSCKDTNRAMAARAFLL
jgi:hypothetical protein